MDEKSLHDEVRGVLVKHLYEPINNSLRKLSMGEAAESIKK